MRRRARCCPAPLPRSASSSASLPGTFPSPSSRARSPPRSRRAIRVIAKPAEETPLIAAEAVRVLHEAGVPRDALQLMPGAGEVGAALVADAPRAGRRLHRLDAGRAADRESSSPAASRAAARPCPSSPRPAASTRWWSIPRRSPSRSWSTCCRRPSNSAGQRCSALRILCLQDDVADRMLKMLKGAMAELEIGDPRRLSVDVGPVITRGGARRDFRPHRENARAAATR